MGQALQQSFYNLLSGVGTFIPNFWPPLLFLSSDGPSACSSTASLRKRSKLSVSTTH